MEMLGEIAPSIEQTLVTKNTVIFEWTNFEGLEWKWVSLLTTNCPIIPFSPSAHALYSSFLFPLFPSFITFSLSYAQYQGVFAFRRLSPQGKCDFLRTKCQWATVALQLRMRQDAPSGGGGGGCSLRDELEHKISSVSQPQWLEVQVQVLSGTANLPYSPFLAKGRG